MFKKDFITHLFGGSPELSAIEIHQLYHLTWNMVHRKERVLVKNLPANSTEGSVRQLFQTYAALGGGGKSPSGGMTCWWIREMTYIFGLLNRVKLFITKKNSIY